MKFNGIEDALNSIIDGFMMNLNVSIPCVVDRYEDGRVTVTPVIKRVFEESEKREPETLASIPNVPVLYPSGAGFSITFPIEQGDEGVLVFSHRDISGFKEKGEIDEPTTFRKHSAADAVFMPCNISSPAHHTELIISDGNGGEIKMSNGQIDLNGVLSINGEPYLGHRHLGVTTGGGTSGGVAP